MQAFQNKLKNRIMRLEMYLKENESNFDKISKIEKSQIQPQHTRQTECAVELKDNQSVSCSYIEEFKGGVQQRSINLDKDLEYTMTVGEKKETSETQYL